MEYHPLPNNCHRGKIGVSPKNWNTSQAKMNSYWRIFYEFTDNNLKQTEPVTIRRMNKFKTLKERQDSVKDLIAREEKLLEAGYNPIRKDTIQSPGLPVRYAEQSYTVETALLFALKKKKMDENTRRVCKSSMNVFLREAKKFGYDNMPAHEIRRKHIVNALDDLKDSIYNECRARMQMLFKELVKREIIEFNPIDEHVEKRSTVRPIRKTLTRQERIIIDKYLKDNFYTFWRFKEIFFKSLPRETELMRVRKCDVDLENQQFNVIVKKRKGRYDEVPKIINDESIPLWKEIMNEAKDNDYLFGEGLKPSPVPIQPYQITKRWYRLIKKSKNPEIRALNITADFYSMHHTSVTTVKNALSAKKAAELKSHKSEALVVNIYDVEREQHKQRENDELKRLKIPFV